MIRYPAALTQSGGGIVSESFRVAVVVDPAVVLATSYLQTALVDYLSHCCWNFVRG